MNTQMDFIEIITFKDACECKALDSKSINLWNFDQWENELKKENVVAFGSKSNNQIISICVLYNNFEKVEINYFSVHPSFTRKGLGKKLLYKIFEYCSNKKIEEIILEVSSTNSVAKEFYSKFGFKTIAIRKNYYRNGSDALIQQKKLLKK